MRVYPVISSNILHMGYDESTGELLVHFHQDAWYAYRGVGPDIFGSILAASSVGKAFNTLVKSDPHRYPYYKVSVDFLPEPEAAGVIGTAIISYTINDQREIQGLARL